MNNDLKDILDTLRRGGARYARTERYYRGEHNLAFASEKFTNTFGPLFREFALNLCPAVCDAVRDRLRISGFAPSAERTADAAGAAAEIWHRNRLQLRSAEVHREALVNGDAYVIVWPDEGGLASIQPNRAASAAAIYDDERPGTMTMAAKYWRAPDGRTRLNIFYPDRVEKFATRRPAGGFLPESEHFEPFADGAGHTVENPFGVVPVFHFANNADIGAAGRSELESAIPIQDGLNKAVLDMLVTMEFAAFRQRWAAGLHIRKGEDGTPLPPFEAGIDHLWVSTNSEARFGEFGTTDLEQFLKVKDSFRIDIASVTGTPMYYLMPHTRGFPSGEALRKAESRFTAKVRDRQAAFGETWARAMEFALRIEGRPGARLEVEWENPAAE